MRTANRCRDVTRVIAGHTLTLPSFRRYLATRPMADRTTTRFAVSITDITDGFASAAQPVRVIPDLDYDQANEFLAAFNNGATSFEGRAW